MSALTEDEAEAALETINVSGMCAATRLLQLRLYGPGQVHDLLSRKVRELQRDTREGIGEEYGEKARCALAATPRWFLCLHAWRRVKGGSGDLHRSLVFCDEEMRCWLVAETDLRIDVGAVDRARQSARSLATVLRALRYPVGDVSFCVFTPCCREIQAEHLRGRLSRQEVTEPEPLPACEAESVRVLSTCDLGRQAVEKIPRSEGDEPTRLRAGCDPPPGSRILGGKTVLPR
eukprot:TRINITY_DN33926_c0_g1_i1.p1 TRINITY_DN33926_c0_g1~~TRINITY_DN33926_c0_g1_i1.p1  ORF type:complete len:233 (+),score=40.56 TRINITY_DN33926_c0_g1_i1:72-770(+)